MNNIKTTVLQKGIVVIGKEIIIRTDITLYELFNLTRKHEINAISAITPANYELINDYTIDGTYHIQTVDTIDGTTMPCHLKGYVTISRLGGNEGQLYYRNHSETRIETAFTLLEGNTDYIIGLPSHISDSIDLCSLEPLHITCAYNCTNIYNQICIIPI